MLHHSLFSSTIPRLLPSPTHLLLLLHHRTFVDARVKWVRDPYLDYAVEREKNLKPSLSLKNLILKSPSSSLPLTSPSLSNPHNISLLPTTSAVKFLRHHPSLFTILTPDHSPLPHVKLTRPFLSRHREEVEIHETERFSAAERLCKLMMLAGCGRIPLRVVEDLKIDMGFPDDVILDLVSWFPDWFRVCVMTEQHQQTQTGGFGLELVDWRKELAVSGIEKRVLGDEAGKRGRGMSTRIEFPMSFSPGFDLQKRVKEWTDDWQKLPYISPYENAFHLEPCSDQAEKWAVAVVHELLSITVSKKTEMINLFSVGEYLGFGWKRFKKAIVHFPGVFYYSNKIRTQTVVLREAYRKDTLLVKHPLMGMRYRYVHLMSKSWKLRKSMKKVRCMKKVVV